MLASFVVWICLVMSEVGVGWGLWVYMSDVYGYLRCLQVFAGAHPLSGGEFILFWHSPEKPNCFHQAKLRHQNVHIYPEQKWLGFVIF